ncbi:hypothetical protein K491DRAFT_754289 [Lophiostoma macrostomum CBS 122681]|uniref:Uncharacterized protein n=1 Tax=Lophiostoma macrostomum CBS 122681 TaxID=1314788 RepID=A0A6A6TL15_9PLEO|nr:hypothetical protein K491DRAFT_754289 [Lophiostoma macrostomum CBS 122681]
MGLRLTSSDMAGSAVSHQGFQDETNHHTAHAESTARELINRLHAITNEHVRTERLPDPAFPLGDLPPDIVQARRERHAAMNNEVTRMLRTRQSSEQGAPVSLRGMGTYTHVELPTQPPRFPHQQRTKPKPAFLPLGGPNRQSTGVRAASEVPGPVKAAYAKLKEALLQEEQVDDQRNPGSRFEPLPVPDATTLWTNNAEDVETGVANGFQGVVDQMRNKRRQSNVGGSAPQPTLDEERRGSVAGGDVAMGGVPATGTIYDASRDPRKRARKLADSSVMERT